MTLALTVGSADLTAYLQSRSMGIKFNTADFTVIDPSDNPNLNDDVTITGAFGTWTGHIVGIERSSYGKLGEQSRWFKCTARNAHALTEGSGTDLTDASPPANYGEFIVKRTRNEGVNEGRATVVVYDDLLWPGDVFDMTCAVEGFSGQTFTVMEMQLTFPTDDDGEPRYQLDLGEGDFDTATTGGAGGGSLGPPTMGGVIDDKCDDCGGDGGGGQGGGLPGGEPTCDSYDSGCEVVDDFNRTVSPGWGTSSGGASWAWGGAEQNPGVTPTYATLIDLPTRTNLHGTFDTDGDISNNQHIDSGCTGLPIDIKLAFTSSTNSMDSDDAYDDTGGGFYNLAPNIFAAMDGHRFSVLPGVSGHEISIVSEGGIGYVAIRRDGTTYFHAPVSFGSFTPDDGYQLRIEMTATQTRVKVWKDGDGEPAWMDTQLFDASGYSGSVGLQFNAECGIAPVTANTYPALQFTIYEFSVNSCNGTSGSGGTAAGVVFEANVFDDAAGPHSVVFDTFYETNSPYATLADIPAATGLTLANGGKDITASANGTYAVFGEAVVTGDAGDFQLGHPMFNSNPRWSVPGALLGPTSSLTFDYVITCKAGDTIVMSYENTGAAKCIDYVSLAVTRIGGFSQ